MERTSPFSSRTLFGISSIVKNLSEIHSLGVTPKATNKSLANTGIFDIKVTNKANSLIKQTRITDDTKSEKFIKIDNNILNIINRKSASTQTNSIKYSNKWTQTNSNETRDNCVNKTKQILEECDWNATHYIEYAEALLQNLEYANSNANSSSIDHCECTAEATQPTQPFQRSLPSFQPYMLNTGKVYFDHQTKVNKYNHRNDDNTVTDSDIDHRLPTNAYINDVYANFYHSIDSYDYNQKHFDQNTSSYYNYTEVAEEAYEFERKHRLRLQSQRLNYKFRFRRTHTICQFETTTNSLINNLFAFCIFKPK